jgi:hypothetical protein
MTKKSVKVEVNNFVGGLITEASPLNFPANATTDELNFVLNRDGTRDRRFGMDFEAGYNLVEIPATLAEMATTSPVPYQWFSVDGDANVNIMVVQVKDSLIFFDLDNTVITSASPLGTISLASEGFPDDVRYSFTDVNGRLIVAAGVSNIASVTYDGTTFAATSETIKTRDIWGLEVTEEPAYETDILYRGGLPETHQYNLYNQSWGIPRPYSALGALPMNDPVGVYNGVLSKYPSNSEVVWTGLYFQPAASGVDPYERLYPTLFEQAFGSKVKAPKGYFIIDLLARGPSRTAAMTANADRHPELSLTPITPVADTTPGGATIVTEFAGRVWYAGFSGKVVDGDSRSPNLSSYVAFSQLVSNSLDITKCYQSGDPTSRESNDLVDTDGGLIRLSGAEEIVNMVNIGSSLLVFATNGVWAISGGDRNGFTATNYKVDHLSTFGTIAPLSVVSDGSRALYWAADGIYVVDKNQIGDWIVNNLIQKNIQSFYEDIPIVGKSSAIGVFEAAGKRIRWLYHYGDRFTEFSDTRELILDLTLGAFYPFKIMRTAGNAVEVVSVFASTPFNSPSVVGNPNRTSGVLESRYLTVVNVAGDPYFTFSYYNNDKFLDWKSFDSVGYDAAAFLTTGAITANDSSVAKQVPYLTLHFRRTELGVDESLAPQYTSSCFVRSQWDWANSANSNKWGSLFQGYRQRKEYLPTSEDDDYDTGFEVVTSRSKLRGRGKAFSLFMETEAGKDCRILGWSISLNGNPV